MLAILTTHPIQYQVPLWQALAKDGTVPFEVWYLSNHGTQLSYDAEFKHNFAWDIETLAGYPYRFLPVNTDVDINRFGKVRLAQPLTDLFQQKNVKVLWVQGWQVMAYWQAVWQAHQQGIQVWLRAESNDLHRSHWLKQLPRQILLKQLFKRVSYFLYIGTANRRLYQQFGVPESKLVPAPYCVDNQRFSQAAKALVGQRTALRAQWNIPERATCFLFCGKFIPKKHPDHLLQAAMVLRQENPVLDPERFHILMVGDGELREQLETMANQLAIMYGRRVVTFAGFLNQTAIPQAYVAADCLVLPSDAGETWGLVVNEALACGRPAIVSHLCGCAEDLACPVNKSLVYEFHNLQQLAQSVSLFVNQYGSQNINSAVLSGVINKFHITNTLSSVKEVYECINQR